MSTRYPSRAADEEILAMLRLRRNGRGCSDIAAMFHTTQQNVSFHTAKILKADLAESGEPASSVRAGYWA